MTSIVTWRSKSHLEDPDLRYCSVRACEIAAADPEFANFSRMDIRSVVSDKLFNFLFPDGGRNTPINVMTSDSSSSSSCTIFDEESFDEPERSLEKRYWEWTIGSENEDGNSPYDFENRCGICHLSSIHRYREEEQCRIVMIQTNSVFVFFTR